MGDEQQLDIYFQTIVNEWSECQRLDDKQMALVKKLVAFTSLPEIVILRIGSELHALTEEREARYEELCRA